MKKSVLLLCFFLLIFSGWFSLKDFTRISISKATTIAYYCDPQKNFSDNYQLQISHNVDEIKQWCDKIVLLRDGNVDVFDDVDEGIAAYQGTMNEK